MTPKCQRHSSVTSRTGTGVRDSATAVTLTAIESGQRSVSVVSVSVGVATLTMCQCGIRNSIYTLS